MSSATKGDMQMVTGAEWILHENNLPDFEWVPSASSITSETERYVFVLRLCNFGVLILVAHRVATAVAVKQMVGSGMIPSHAIFRCHDFCSRIEEQYLVADCNACPFAPWLFLRWLYICFIS